MTATRWYVFDTEGHRVEGEEHSRPQSAERVMLVLNAQELKYGRAAIYSVHPRIEPSPLESLNLPDWAVEVFRALTPKTIPGQLPYTLDEYQKLGRLLTGALDAEEQFSEDELERHAEFNRKFGKSGL